MLKKSKLAEYELDENKKSLENQRFADF